MEFTPTPAMYAIIGFLVGMAIGWVIGFFDSNNRTAKKIQMAETAAKDAMEEAERKIAAAKAELPQPAAPQFVAQDQPGLLRLQSINGQYALEMDGAPIRNGLPPEGKKRLIELLTAIRPFLESAAPPPAPRPVAPVVDSPAAAVPAPRVNPVANAAPVSPVTPAAKEEKKKISSLSIVGQIDFILQERLLNSPLAQRGIHLTESAEGGLQVVVGLEKFATVDDVPYADVKSFIRAAITEWENKFTPGL